MIRTMTTCLALLSSLNSTATSNVMEVVVTMEEETTVEEITVEMDLTKTAKKRLKCGTWNCVNASVYTNVRTSVSHLSLRIQS